METDFYELHQDKSREMLKLSDTSEAKVKEELFACDECGDIFGLKDDLKTHMKKLHE